MGKKNLEELEAERLALEQEAYDDKNRMLKQSQFQELLELQTDEEPEFVEEIVAMFVDDAEAMLVELEELFAEGAETPIDYAKARGVLHKLKGSSSTFGADAKVGLFDLGLASLPLLLQPLGLETLRLLLIHQLSALLDDNLLQPRGLGVGGWALIP